MSKRDQKIVAIITFMFQIVNVQIIIPRKKIQIIFEIIYNDSQRSIKTLIKDL